MCACVRVHVCVCVCVHVCACVCVLIVGTGSKGQRHSMEFLCPCRAFRKHHDGIKFMLLAIG